MSSADLGSLIPLGGYQHKGGCRCQIRYRLAFFRILENAVALISTNCCGSSVLVATYISIFSYLELAEIRPKLLEAFLQGNETGGDLGCSSAPGLCHSFLVEECLQPELELYCV